MAVPKRFRDDFQEEDLTCLYVAPGTEQSLSLYSMAAFDRLAQQLAAVSSKRADIRNYLRLFYARAEKVDVDSQGRIRIPDRLAEFAKLNRDVVLIGVQDHAEVWDVELWNTFLEQHHSEFDEMADKLFD